MNRPNLLRSLPAWLTLGLVFVVVAAGIWRAVRMQQDDPAGMPPAGIATTAAAPAPADRPASTSAVGPDGRIAAAAPRGLLARAETLEERWLDDPSSTERPRRLRLARLAGSGRLVRVVERVRSDAATGQLITAGREVMRADAVLVAVPRDGNALDLVARLRAAGFATEPAQAHDAAVCLLVPTVTLDAVEKAIAALGASMPDLVAEPDFIRFPTQVTPNDYNTARLWGLEKIEAPAAWTVSTGSPGVVVAVIDSGISSHPDLVANQWTNSGEIAGNSRDDDDNGYIDDIHGWNFMSGNATITDSDGHGTHVSGTIGATGNNATGLVGVNWNVRIMTLRAGDDTFADSALANCLRYITRMRQAGVNVVAANMSLGGAGFNSTLRQEIINAGSAGVLVVAAAGNLSSDDTTLNNDVEPMYPASYDAATIIAVASSNHADSLSYFSHYGATSVDLAAPGTAVLSTYLGGAYARLDGTSMAAPHVAGAVALVAAADPALTALQLRARILDTVDPVAALAGRVATGGRLNLRRAVSPSLLRPRIVITDGDGDPAEVAAVDRAGLSLTLGAALQTENGTTPAATLAWTLEEGPEAAGFSATAGASTEVTFPVAGRYRVRATATSGTLQEHDEIVVAVGPDTTVTSSGLQAWWHFDDTGSTTADSSGNSRVGTVTAATRSSTAVLGTAMEFNGTSSRVGFNTPTLSQLTIGGWARASAANGTVIFPRIVHMREGLLFGGFDPTNASQDDGNVNTLKFALDNGVSDVVWHSPPGTFSVGAWYHVAVTYDPTATYPAPVFYINGVRQLTGTQSSSANASVVPIGTGFIGYGEIQSGGLTYTRPWLGQLDEIRLFNRVLGDAEVSWMSREVVVAALAGGSLSAGSSADPFAVPISFTPASTGLGAPQLLNVRWSEVGGTASFTATGSGSATAAFTAPGTHLMRFDATSSDGVCVTRTLAVDVPLVSVTREGYYTGTTATGGIWTLLVRSDGTGTFFSSGSRGSFQRDFVVPEWGIFTITDRSGTTVTGRIFADGSVSGTIDGSTTFSGARTTAGLGTADSARDGTYTGWVVDSGVRAAAQVERGLLSLVIEESGDHRAAVGAIDAGGAFTLVPAAGVAFTGVASAGRLDGDIVFPGLSTREIVLLRDDTQPVRRLTNISVRGVVGSGDDVLIPGFVIEDGTLPVLVRAIGPGLIPFNVPADIVLQQPRMILRQKTVILRENTGWSLDGHADEIIAANALTQAFQLNPTVPDSALTLPLPAESYTVEIRGADGGTGIALAELYDAGTAADAGTLVNISGRGFVGTGDNILIGGFVVAGDAPVLVLVRAAGPALTRFGVSGVLARPRLTVLRDGTTLQTGGAWSAGDSPATIAEAARAVAAFSFPSGSEDAALLLFLPPGKYDAHVNGHDGGTGVALLEIYRVEGM